MKTFRSVPPSLHYFADNIFGTLSQGLRFGTVFALYHTENNKKTYKYNHEYQTSF